VITAIVFFAILATLAVRAVAKANRNFSRNKPMTKNASDLQAAMMAQVPVKTSWAGIPGSTNQPPAQPGNSPTYKPGDSATYQPGDSATYKPGDSATYQPGDSQTYKPGNSATYKPGDSSTYQPGDSATYKPGDSPTYQPGNSPTYAPGNYPVDLDPAELAPKPWMKGPPGTRPLSGSRRTPKGSGQRGGPDRGVQPSYATRMERQTELRDQGILDRDKRTAARTDPTQAPQEGSTAISSTSLNTTLVTPYQPSSLMTSLSSSLTSSLFDTPTTVPASAALGAVPAVALSPDVEDDVVILLREGNEVEAVRIVIDRMNVGLLEATTAVRSYADRRRR
jgi:hypothetical protein